MNMNNMNQELFDGLKHLVALARKKKQVEDAKSAREKDWDVEARCRERVEAYERAMELLKKEWHMGVGHGSTVEGEVRW